MTRFGSFHDIGAETPHAGIARRVLDTAQATVQEYRFEPGATFPLHRHAEEQFTLVLEGEVSMSGGGERRVLAPGEWSVVPGGVEHGITAGSEGARFVAIIVPRRKEPLQ